jgi:SAM-dependent methyltransferase
MQNKANEVWKSTEWVDAYLSGTRGAIPFAAEQIQIMMLLIAANERKPTRFLDLGCGDGILSSAILAEYPNAKAVLADFSPIMLDAARTRLADSGAAVELVTIDYSVPTWTAAVNGAFDLIVSGLSIHHQTDERKRGVYAEIFSLLEPGGLFVNIERVSSPSAWVNSIWHSWMTDRWYTIRAPKEPGCTREQVADDLTERFAGGGDVLAPADDQCDWLREIGYEEVDCYFRVFEIAVFGGRKPL